MKRGAHPPAAEITIRPAALSDVPVLTRLAAQLGYEHPESLIEGQLRTILEDDLQDVFVAVLEDGAAAGWLHICVRVILHREPHAEVAGIVVGDAYRGSGIGRMLMQKAEDWARGRGLTLVSLYTNAVRTRAHRFYENIGYTSRKQSKVYSKEV